MRALFNFFSIFFLINLYISLGYSNIIYDKNNILITEIELNFFTDLYLQSYNKKLSKNKAIKNIILTKNLVSKLKKTNKNYLNQIDNILSSNKNISISDNTTFYDFYRYMQIKNDFLIDYYQNDLEYLEYKKTINSLSKLIIPLSEDDECLIANTQVDMSKNEVLIRFLFDNRNKKINNFKLELDGKIFFACISNNTMNFIQQNLIIYLDEKIFLKMKRFTYEK